MQNKHGKLVNILLVLVLFVGLSLLLYPSVSDYWNSLHQTRAIAVYDEEVANLNRERYEKLWSDADSFNQKLLTRDNPFYLPEEWTEEYESLLNLSGQGIMGYIEIPAIDVSLPIYHSTEERILQVGVGHLEWSSLPVGGESTHCLLSAHTGLPSARLFTDLDRLEVGDTFTLQVLNESLVYEVDQIKVVEPQDSSPLLIEPGQDYCTLITCTPYGINSHRLLVRGRRVEDTGEVIRITADALVVEPLIVAPILALPILLLLLILLLLPRRPGKKHGGEVDEML